MTTRPRATGNTTGGDIASEAFALSTAVARNAWPEVVTSLLAVGVARTLGYDDADEQQKATATGPTDDLDRLIRLAEGATDLWAGDHSDWRMAVAVGSLQASCRQVAASGPVELRQEWITRLEGPLSGVPPMIIVVPGGPLIVRGRAQLTDHLGCLVEAPPVGALCRCGRSSTKPDCDVTCLREGFDDTKDPHRVPDHRDTYVGQQVTVLDNRGICQHSGLCTDRLASVFHSDGTQFVTPSGGRMDEIIRAVRDCPSGALSFALDGTEARGQVDHGNTRPPAVQITQNGPYRVTGNVPVLQGDGSPVPRNDGSSTEHYALCRCGHSQNKPFCSGMHWYSQFRDPVPDQGHVPSLFEWAGGLPALTRMTRIFYERYVPADDLLGPLFATMSADHPQRVAKWLGEVFGGPAAYSTSYGGYPRMLSQHRGRGLTEEQRSRWVQLLTQSARDANLPNDPEFRSAFGSYIEWGSRLAVENSQTDARPPEHMPMPHWGWNTAAGPPGARISALAGRAGEADVPRAPLVVPVPGDRVSYGDHIKQLFRPQDRTSMLFAFDLWSYDDVRRHHAGILGRLRAGTMPCDGAWPAEHVELFDTWIQQGTNA